MRNLKRALSLALASVMLLGMMVVGTSAASYPDVDENDNTEAIEVLNAVKVMIGDHGNFNPDSPVNRHEMAVIMAKLVLGNDTANNYVGTHPFTDVAPWADKYVAACYENGIAAGTSKTTFGGDQPLTAVQAAAFMLRALGYKDLSKGASDWSVPVTATANQIRLFEGVASNPKEQLTRNQVAQLALNTLKSPVVDLKDGTFDVTSGDGQVIISGGAREYIVRSSSEAYARAINRTEVAGTSASSVQGATVELGEHLYNGKLRLEDTTDDFGRPARQWEYDGKAIGSYAKDELLRREYTAKVTGRDLYDLLGKSTIDSILDGGRDDWSLTITVDGEVAADTLKKGDNAYFTAGNLVRTNTNGVGATDKGVLTQVFVDSGEKDVYISIINTYLAKATKDYDTKKEEATFEVYGVQDVESGSAITLVKNTADKSANTPYTEDLKVRVEDIDVSGVKEDDFFLVNVAGGEIKVMTEPEVKSAATITAFKKGSWVNSNGQIDYADTALYDPEVLDEYAQKNMKDLTYDIYLDKYGYLIGLEQNEDPDQYVFITGRQAGDNDLGHANADMRAIFLDGTVKIITVNTKDSDSVTGGAIANTWFKYSVDKNDVYTLEAIPAAMAANVKVAQSVQDATGGDITINKNHTSLDGSGTFNKVYGNDDTVYLGVELNVIGNATKFGSQNDNDSTTYNYYTATANDTNRAAIVDEVNSVTVGVKNVSLTVKDITKAFLGDAGDSTNQNLAMPVNEVYTLYKDNGYVIAAVVIGEDEGNNTNYAYITGDDYNSERYDSANDEWTWTLEAVVNGKIVDLTEKGSTIKHLNKMDQGYWYEVRYDADGNVRGIKSHGNTHNGAVTFTAGTTDQYINTVANYETATDAHDTVLMQVTYSVAAKQLTYKNGTLYTNKAATEGFSVSPSVKTVVALSKLDANNAADPFDSVTDGYDGYSGLEDAIADLDDNFKGYLNVLFDDGVATVIILDDRTGSKVDEGSEPVVNTGSYSSVVNETAAKAITGDPLNLDKAYVNDTNVLVLPAHYGQGIHQQLLDALAHLGYKVTGEKYASSVWTFTTEKDGRTAEITCNVTKNTGNIGVTAAEYALVDVDGTKSYVAVGGTVAVANASKGTGYIKTETGVATAYDDYGNYTVLTGKDAVIRTGYVSVAVPTASGSVSTKVAGASVTWEAPTYVEDGVSFTVKMKVAASASVSADTTVGWTVTGGTASGNPTTIATADGTNGKDFTFTITNTAKTKVSAITAALS